MTAWQTAHDASWLCQLRLPVIAAPMFLVSGPHLTIASTQAGVLGAFPTLNARSTQELSSWIDEIEEGLRGHEGLYAVNLVVNEKFDRYQQDLALIAERRVPLVITSIGSPLKTIEKLRSYGGRVFADVASIKHARMSADAGADGLVLLCAGAGGNCGWLNPFAFVAAVREFFDGPIALAGGIGTGQSLLAARTLGATLAYVGTPFIVASESLASKEYRDAVLAADADSIVNTRAVTGIPSNILRASLEEYGIDANDRPGEISRIVPAEGIQRIGQPRPWRDIWTAGQGVGLVRSVEPAAAIVDRLCMQYDAARRPN